MATTQHSVSVCFFLLQLSALDLSGLRVVTDSLAPTFASLRQLLVLQLNGTSCSDATIEWLTYGQRLHEWQQQQQVQLLQPHGQQVHHATPVAAAHMGAAQARVNATMQGNDGWPW